MNRRRINTEPCLSCGKVDPEPHDLVCFSRRMDNIRAARDSVRRPRSGSYSRSRSADFTKSYGSRHSYVIGTSQGGSRPNSPGGSCAGSMGNSVAGSACCSGSQSSISLASSDRNSSARSCLSVQPIPAVLGHMDDITAYWGAYTTPAGVEESPFYTRIEIPVNPHHYEQWRNNVFSPPSWYRAMLPEVVSKATFTLRAVLPIPVRYLSQMSSLQLEYLARSLFDDQYEERKASLKGDGTGDDDVERLKRTYTTLDRIGTIYETRLDEGLEDTGSSYRHLSDEIQGMLIILGQDMNCTERDELDGRDKCVASPQSTPLIFTPLGSRSQTPDVRVQPGSTNVSLEPRTRGGGFRSLFQRTRHSPCAEGNSSIRAQASSSPQNLSPTPGLITMTISTEDISALHHVVMSGRLNEAAFHAIQNIVENNTCALNPATRLVESGQLTEAAAHAINDMESEPRSRSVSPKSRFPRVEESYSPRGSAKE